MKRISVPVAMIAGILALLLTSSVSFAHDWRPFKARHGKVVVVEKHYVVHSYADPYRRVTPYHGRYYDRPHRHVYRLYDPWYDPRDAYGVRGVIHRPSGVFSFSIGHW